MYNYNRRGQPSSSIYAWTLTRLRRVLVIPFLKRTYEKIDTK